MTSSEAMVHARVQTGWSANGRPVTVVDDAGDMWVVRYEWCGADLRAIDATGAPTEFAGKLQRIHRLFVTPIYTLVPHPDALPRNACECESAASPAPSSGGGAS